MSSANGTIHSDLWEQHLYEWLPVQFDVATRAHFMKVMEMTRETSHERQGTVGGGWLLDETEQLAVIWGNDEAPLAVEGEGMMIVGPQGVGKTTIAQQLVLALAGLRDTCLGLPVRRERGKILYLAMDRPQQIKRSWKRMLTEDDRKLLEERVILWRGALPPAVKLTKSDSMASWARSLGATHVVVDSYKDVAANLSNEETATLVNWLAQGCVNSGIGWTGLHHNRKANADNPHPKELQDIYGSTFLTAGLGSIISIYGKPGAELVECKHVKQPLETFGTFGVRHDHNTGHSEIAGSLDEEQAKEEFLAFSLWLGKRSCTDEEAKKHFGKGARTAKRRLDDWVIDEKLAKDDGGSHQKATYKVRDKLTNA